MRALQIFFGWYLTLFRAVVNNATQEAQKAHSFIARLPLHVSPWPTPIPFSGMCCQSQVLSVALEGSASLPFCFVVGTWLTVMLHVRC